MNSQEMNSEIGRRWHEEVSNKTKYVAKYLKNHFVSENWHMREREVGRRWEAMTECILGA